VRSNIPAKGLSGEGYEGHYFWDTEIFMVPFFTLTNPAIAKNLLRFRYETLSNAKEEAVNLGHKKGAKIPWRTIAGSECSAYFPGGSAQYHINADVAYSNIQYYLYSSDLSYIRDYGFEVILETARLWLEIGHFDELGRFLIDGVTGPDEYTAFVNNNYYTNAMAQYHLEWTVKFSRMLQKNFAASWQELTLKLHITTQEIENMEQAAQKMFLPYNEELGIHMQDDSFLGKKEWDFKYVPRENYPLVLHYHPMYIYRHKVLKQADVVLAHFLLDSAPEEVIDRSYHYYEKLTTHDSSLSPCVHSIMASRINDPEKAYHYLVKTLRLDLDNLHNNTKDGLHIANAGGAYMAIVYGFGGLRIKEDGLHLKPTKPHRWSKMVFPMQYQGALVKVTLEKRILIETDQPIDLWIDGKLCHVESYLEVPYHGKH
jgi:alpha,alpha-trehalose phosphorylase